MTGMTRRGFVETTGAFLAAALARPASATARHMDTQAREPLFRISLAEWSLHRSIEAGRCDNLDFPVVARREYALDAVEYVNTFFRGMERDAAYLRELRTRADDHGVRSLLIMCDGEGAVGDPNERARATAVENHYRWVEAAQYLGCESIRVNAQSEGSPAQQHALAVDGLQRIAEFAAEHDISVLVENHGGLSSNGGWLAGVIAAVGHPGCGTLPDFGNFELSDGEWYDRYRGVGELMPFAKAVSAKSHEFDAQGNERHTDYRRMLRIVLDAGYRGHIGIEYEGTGLSEPDGIRATKALLERTRTQLEGDYR